MAEIYPPPPGSLPRAGQQTSTMAIISLIAGILGLTLIPFLGSIIAVVIGPMARREITESGGALGGEGLATAGIVLGWIGIGLTVLTACGVGLMFAVPACLFSFNILETNTLFPALLTLF